MTVDKRSTVQNVVTGLLAAAEVYAIVIILGNSWLKMFMIVAALVPGLVWLVTHGKIKETSKLFVVGVMIFAITFASVESYLFYNAGYTPTYSSSEPEVSVSFQGFQNVSLTQILQGIEQSPTFGLLRFEYGGNIKFEFMKIEVSNYSGGYLGIDFFEENSNDYFHFYSSNDHQYTLEKTSYQGH